MVENLQIVVNGVIIGSNMKVEVFLFDDYCFVEDELFMNDCQMEYFCCKLLVWKVDILEESCDIIEVMKELMCNIFDIVDWVFEEMDCVLELWICDCECKLVFKIDVVLCCFENGEYGYCEVIGELISLC